MAQHALRQRPVKGRVASDGPYLPNSQPQPDDSRDRLDSAILRHAALVAEVEAGEKALAETEDKILDAHDALKQAIQRADEAPERMMRYRVAAAMGGATAEEIPMPSLNVEAANAALERAKADLESLKVFRDELEKQLRRARDDVRYAASTVRDRVAAVVCGSKGVKALLAKHEATRAELYRLQVTLKHIDGRNGIPHAHRLWQAIPYAVDLTPDPAWVAALEALTTDANAALPD